LLIAPNYLGAPDIFAMAIVSFALPIYRHTRQTRIRRVRLSLFAEILDQCQSARAEGGQIHLVGFGFFQRFLGSPAGLADGRLK
jgi:hypothetical protein